uniref:Transposase n=1 Tax=Acrobeloides nanus TaxID=290746 RepID=A0A914DAE9_9BILA
MHDKTEYQLDLDSDEEEEEYEEPEGKYQRWVWKSPSGLMHADHATEWLEKIFVPNAEPESLLLIDKWSGYKQCLSSNIIADYGYKVRILPAGTTGKLQPLDVFVNRQIKSFIRIISDKVRWKYTGFKLAQRVNVLKLISAMVYQFTAPQFIPYLKFCWHKAGFVNERPPPFRTPVQYCLQDLKFMSKCICGNMALLQCAHCENPLCFVCSVVNLHQNCSD